MDMNMVSALNNGLSQHSLLYHCADDRVHLALFSLPLPPPFEVPMLEDSHKQLGEVRF